MKKYNKILEAVHRGILLALDDYQDIDPNNSISHYTDVINVEDQSVVMINSLYKRIALNRFTSEDLKDILILYKITKIKYSPKTKKELLDIINALSKMNPNNVNLNWIDISNLKDLTRIFAKSSGLTIDCSEWDTRHVEKFNYIFAFINKSTSIKANNWQFDSAKEFDGMFYFTSNTVSVEIDAEHWNTKNVTTMKNMFSHCSNQNFLHYATKLDISGCTNFEQMFANSKCKEDLSNWEIPVSAIGIRKDPFAFGSMFAEVLTMENNMLPKIIKGKTPKDIFKSLIETFCKETNSTVDFKNAKIMDTGTRFLCNYLNFSDGTSGFFIKYHPDKWGDGDFLVWFNTHVATMDACIPSDSLNKLIKKFNTAMARRMKILFK